jgi:mannitol 2-dehydrogenase
MSNVVRLSPATTLPLSNATLSLHSRNVVVPTYDRAALTPAIVHLGVGGFHRAHQAVYLDDLANKGISRDWGVTGVGLRRPDMKNALVQQDCLYTVVERSAEHEKGRVIGSMSRYLYARQEWQQVLAALIDERTRIVSLTITGDGYRAEETPAVFDASAREVPMHQPDGNPPTTAWSFLAEALDQRRRAGTAPFTVMSCDNLPNNGEAARAALVSSAALRSESLAAWIDENVAFPSTMVDRITPKTSPDDRAAVEDMFKVSDRWPVITEPYTQWVIEDAFCNGRPPLEQVGAEMVDDVAAHKLVKSRLLNGSHCALGYLGLLAGYQRTDEAMRDPVIFRYIEQLMREEIAPLLPPVPGMDIGRYRQILLQRLMNPRISDQLSRLVARGSTKMPSYLLPSLVEARAQRRPHALLSIATAAWMRYLRGYDFAGRALPVVDPRARELTTLAKVGLHDPKPLLGVREVFGNLGHDAALVADMREKLRQLDRLGVQSALQRTLSGSDMTAAG